MSSTPHTSRRQWLLVAAAACLGAISRAQAANFQQTTWEALVPDDWDPMKSFTDMQNMADLPDSDPRVQALYERMRKIWDEAPTVQSMRGRNVKIPGFVVPLDVVA